MTDNAPKLVTVTKIVPAGGQVDVDNPGTFVSCMKSTSTVTSEITVNLGGGGALRFDQGDKHRVPDSSKFSKVTLNNSSGSAITVTLAVGDGDTTTAQQVTVAGTVTVSGTVTPAVPGSVKTVADVVCNSGGVKTQLLAADATRKTAIIKSLSSNTTSGRVGDTNVTASRGAELEAGQPVTIDGTDAIYLYNNSAANITVTITTTNT